MSSLIWLATFTLLGLIDLWVEPRTNGSMYMFGISVRDNGHHSISYSLGGIAWWFVGLPLIAVLLRLRRRPEPAISGVWLNVAGAATVLMAFSFGLVVFVAHGA